MTIQEAAQKKFVFVCGLHRSGTSLLFKILKDHPEVSGFADTGVPEDEGQHLQTVFQPAHALGGPGRFGFKKESYLNENSLLATEASAQQLLTEWGQYWDKDASVLIEKSPPNLVRMRFFQTLFAKTYFIIILRHPVAVSLAQKRRGKAQFFPLHTIFKHWLVCHQQMMIDYPFLKHALVLRYESLAKEPDSTLACIWDFLELQPSGTNQAIKSNVNEAYYLDWQKQQENIISQWYTKQMIMPLEVAFNSFGYSIKDPETIVKPSYEIIL